MPGPDTGAGTLSSPDHALADGASFRDRALEEGGNPLEQLDRLYSLTARRTWAAVAALAVLVGALVVWGVVAQRDVTVSAPGILVPRGGFIEVQRLEAGLVQELHVNAGDRVEEGDVLAVYVPVGGEPTPIVAPVDGQVEEIAVAPGSTLVPGLPAFTILPTGAEREVYALAFASPAVQPQLHVAQEVAVEAASAPPAQYGSIVGIVARIGETPITFARLNRLTGGNEELARGILAGGPTYEVQVRLRRDAATPSGVRWTTDQGPDFRVPAGTLVSVTALVDREPSVSGLFG